MSILDAANKIRAQAMARALAESRRNSLVVRMPDLPNIADEKFYTAIDISLKVWDVLTGLLDIAGAVKLAFGAKAAATVSVEAIAASEAAAQAAATVGLSSKVTTALTVGEAITLAGPLVAYIGLWVGLGAPYLEAKQKIAEDHARRGVAHGVLAHRSRATSARRYRRAVQGREPNESRLQLCGEGRGVGTLVLACCPGRGYEKRIQRVLMNLSAIAT